MARPRAQPGARKAKRTRFPKTPRPRAFIAFAGGGAKGIAHVGALKALESRRVKVLGYAGTSAGAIVATLAAAGFRADRILHPTEPSSILDELRVFDPSLKSATDLFGPNAWSSIALGRGVVEWFTPGRLKAAAGVAIGTLLFSALALGVYGFPAGALVLLFWAIVAGILAVIAASVLLGVAKLQTLRNALAKLLSQELYGRPDLPVTFEDLATLKRPALKIVAANLSTERLKLFSADETPRVEVADAVAATICLPVIFDLWELTAHRYVDGGVVSNLPAWPFDEERAVDADAMTIAFDIGEPEPENGDAQPAAAPAIGRLVWLMPLLKTMMSGAAALNLRAVGPSELITLRPRIRMMGFDLAAEETREVLRNMTAAARAAIDERLLTFPRAYRNACAKGVLLTENTLDLAPSIFAAGQRQGRVRVAVAFKPEGYFHTLQLKFGANFERDTDQGIVLPIEHSLVGVAWEQKEPYFDIAPFPSEFSLKGEEHQALERLIWRELAWSLRVPIFDAKGGLRCVVTVDGSDKLKDTTETREVFEDLEDQISRVFTRVVRRLKEAGSNGPT